MSEASTLLQALRAHYIGPEPLPGGVFLTEVQVPQVEGRGIRRADALYLGFTRSRGHSIDVHELKVTPADFRAELLNPLKAESWWRYSSRFWIVSPGPHVTPIADIPDGWGLMCPKARGRRFDILVKPAFRKPEVDLSLLIEIAKRLDTMRADEVSAAVQKLRYEWQDKYNALRAERQEANIPAGVKERLEMLEAIEAAAGVKVDSIGTGAGMWARRDGRLTTVPQLGEALRLAMQTVKATDQAGGLIDRVTKQLANIREDVETALTRASAARAAHDQLCSTLAPPPPPDEIPLTLPQPPWSDHG